MSKSEEVDRIERGFPAPEFRKNQKEVINETINRLEEGYDVVLLDAPTGFGKSIVLETIANVYDGDAFLTTPLNVLVDQMENDEFIGDRIITMKGRNNYECIHPREDAGTTVDKAICQRESDFECEIKEQCEYYGRKMKALNHPEVVTNMSYLIGEGMIPDAVDTKFDPRDLLIIDECQSLESWALNFVGLTISERVVPDSIWKVIKIPNGDKEDDLEYIVKWLREDVIPPVEGAIEDLDRMTLKSEDNVTELDRLKNFRRKIQLFLDDVEDNEWICQIETEVKKHSKNKRKVKFKPVKVGRFLQDLVWNRADKIILSSATIPKGSWLQEIGLGDKKSIRLSVPSEFPVGNRPIKTECTVGKMTYKKREANMPNAVEVVKSICDDHEGEKGIMHCRGYNFIEMFRRSCRNNGYYDWVRRNCHIQDRNNREESLEEWKDNDKQLFLSVNMAEGIDLAGDLCRFQILLKVLYPNMGDKRVNYRVKEMNDWDWYNRKAITQIEQAYGRAVRSPEDEAVMYVLDSSAIGLIKRNKRLFHDWFLEGLVDMEV